MTMSWNDYNFIINRNWFETLNLNLKFKSTPCNWQRSRSFGSHVAVVRETIILNLIDIPMIIVIIYHFLQPLLQLLLLCHYKNN